MMLLKHDAVRSLAVVLLVALATLSVVHSGEQYVIRLTVTFLIYAMVGMSLDLLVGYGGLVSFGHAAFFGIGVYATAVSFAEGQDGLGGMIVASVLASAAAAAFVGGFALRTAGAYFIMITLAFAQMFYFGSVAATKLGGDDGLSLKRGHIFGMPMTGDLKPFAIVVLIFFCATFLLCSRLVGSSFGRTIRATRDNEARVRASGYDPFGYKLALFTVAGAIAGMAGSLHANLNEFSSPSSLHWILSGEFLVMVILGGVGTLVGPILGAAAFVGLREVLSSYTSLWMLVMGPIILVVVLFSHGGIWGILRLRAGARHD